MRLIIKKPFHWFIKKRLTYLEQSINDPFETQARLLQQLLNKSKATLFGKQFHFASIKHVKDFSARIPTHTYEQFYPYIERIFKGEQNIVWPTTTRWFAKSSGTTNARSKFIPVSPEALKEGHYKAGKDMLALYIHNYPDSQIARGKSIGLGGSLHAHMVHTKSSTQYGDISAVLMKNLPFWAQWNRTPDLAIALMAQWEKKMEMLASMTTKENVTAIIGVPSWVLLLLQKVISLQHKHLIHDVWPGLELFIHGGISFKPYQAAFQAISAKKLRYVEVYNASEGFFAVQDCVDRKDLLLLLNHGIFYEFIPLNNAHEENPPTVALENVVLGKIYALLISTNAGLWRYKIGDTIQFTSLAPFRIKIIGRTKHFINAFGEEVMVDNAETAIEKASRVTCAIVRDYTAGPRYFKAARSGSHEWIIEFLRPPHNLTQFIDVLDTTLQLLNTDYQAKRYKNLVLSKPVVHCAPQGIFYAWLKQHGKVGDQHKVPRLANDRRYLDEILSMLS